MRLIVIALALIVGAEQSAGDGVHVWRASDIAAKGAALAKKLDAQKVASETIATEGNRQFMIAHREGREPDEARPGRQGHLLRDEGHRVGLARRPARSASSKGPSSWESSQNIAPARFCAAMYSPLSRTDSGSRSRSIPGSSRSSGIWLDLCIFATHHEQGTYCWGRVVTHSGRPATGRARSSDVIAHRRRAARRRFGRCQRRVDGEGRSLGIAGRRAVAARRGRGETRVAGGVAAGLL